MIDNYDSFTYNLIQYVRILGKGITCYRNDKISIDKIEKLQPEKIILSPGPGRPETAGITLSVIRHFARFLPILGICLGHQAIAQAFGAQIIQAPQIMHGKTSLIYHKKTSVFYNIPEALRVTRYHSLLIDPSSLSEAFDITAWTADKDIMGIQHRQWALTGLQFHPESILTEHGLQLMQNFLMNSIDHESVQKT